MQSQYASRTTLNNAVYWLLTLELSLMLSISLGVPSAPCISHWWAYWRRALHKTRAITYFSWDHVTVYKVDGFREIVFIFGNRLFTLINSSYIYQLLNSCFICVFVRVFNNGHCKSVIASINCPDLKTCHLEVWSLLCLRLTCFPPLSFCWMAEAWYTCFPINSKANSSSLPASSLSKAWFLEAAGQDWPAASRSQALLREDGDYPLLFACALGCPERDISTVSCIRPRCVGF